MAQSNFVDYVKIYFTGGSGGRGAVSWRREKYVPKGGPDGGDGGDGGNIIAKGDKQLWTLLDLKYRKFIKAEPGSPGRGSRCKGKNGNDVILKVPLGSMFYDSDTEEFIGEIVADGEELLLLPGGKGGLGNYHFRTATNQAPDYAQPGEQVQERAVIIELKTLADVGLVGFPNAGKSTLLAALTSAKPHIADYPFTTLVPNLGIVKYKDYQSYVMADIPGIIEGAHAGKGLGINFLRHIERNPVLLFLIPISSEDVQQEYQLLRNELRNYKEELLEKEHIIVLTKTDLINTDHEFIQEKLASSPAGVPKIAISAATGFHLAQLSDLIWPMIMRARATSAENFC